MPEQTAEQDPLAHGHYEAMLAAQQPELFETTVPPIEFPDSSAHEQPVPQVHAAEHGCAADCPEHAVTRLHPEHMPGDGCCPDHDHHEPHPHRQAPAVHPDGCTCPDHGHHHHAHERHRQDEVVRVPDKPVMADRAQPQAQAPVDQLISRQMQSELRAATGAKELPDTPDILQAAPAVLAEQTNPKLPSIKATPRAVAIPRPLGRPAPVRPHAISRTAVAGAAPASTVPPPKPGYRHGPEPAPEPAQDTRAVAGRVIRATAAGPALKEASLTAPAVDPPAPPEAAPASEPDPVPLFSITTAPEGAPDSPIRLPEAAAESTIKQELDAALQVRDVLEETPDALDQLVTQLEPTLARRMQTELAEALITLDYETPQETAAQWVGHYTAAALQHNMSHLRGEPPEVDWHEQFLGTRTPTIMPAFIQTLLELGALALFRLLRQSASRPLYMV